MLYEEAVEYAQKAKPDICQLRRANPEDENSPIAELTAVMYLNGEAVQSTESEVHRVECPGDEESYDEAVAAAVADATARFSKHLADEFGITLDRAESIVDTYATNPDLPLAG